MLRLISLLLLLCLPFCQAGAEAMVLVQGYLGNDDPWRRSGVGSVLEQAGWQDGGHLFVTPRGVAGARSVAPGSKRFYTVALPTDAPLLVQLRALAPLMQYIRSNHPGESLYLVGHSAGGVLARLYMVQHPETGVSALVTIASPHLGTASAEAGLLAGDSPLGWVAPLIGAEELNRSRGLYRDLAREQMGNLLFWLNRQPHPRARYVSVVHRGEVLFPFGDLFVPEWSQDMNNVIVLRGRALTIHTGGVHLLTASDGHLLVTILYRLQHS